MDDLRAGLVAAGRAVSEAQQEADAVKRNVASQEAALAGRSGASVDVLRRLGEVSAKLEQKETQLEVRGGAGEPAARTSLHFPRAPRIPGSPSLPLPLSVSLKLRLHTRTLRAGRRQAAAQPLGASVPR